MWFVGVAAQRAKARDDDRGALMASGGVAAAGVERSDQSLGHQARASKIRRDHPVPCVGERGGVRLCNDGIVVRVSCVGIAPVAGMDGMVACEVDGGDLSGVLPERVDGRIRARAVLKPVEDVLSPGYFGRCLRDGGTDAWTNVKDSATCGESTARDRGADELL